jgi:hypothetical protein
MEQAVFDLVTACSRLGNCPCEGGLEAQGISKTLNPRCEALAAVQSRQLLRCAVQLPRLPAPVTHCAHPMPVASRR